MVKKVKTLKELKLKDNINTIIEYLLRKKLDELKQETRSDAKILEINRPWLKDTLKFNLSETIEDITRFLEK